MVGMLDNLDLSHFLAPAGYTPDVPPPGGINMFAGLGGGYGPQGNAPGGPPQSPPPMSLQGAGGGPGAPPPGPPPVPLAAQMPSMAAPTTATAMNPTPGFSFNQGPQPAPADDGSQGLLTGGGPDTSAPPRPGLRGLLDRLTATDPETGRTFADRMMAVGQIMQGDTPGAQAYLEKQQEKVINQRAIALKQQLAQRQATAFANAFRPDGSFDMAGYARDVGGAFDPADLVKLYGVAEPKKTLVPLRGGQGGAVSFDPRTGETGPVIGAGPEKEPTGVWVDPVTHIRGPDPAQVSYQQQIAGIKGKEARETKATTPGKAPGTGTKKKGSYAVGEVKY